MSKASEERHYIDFLLFIPSRPPLDKPTYEILTQVYQGRSTGTAWLGLASYLQELERDYEVKVSMVDWGPSGSLDEKFMELQSGLLEEDVVKDLFPGLPI